MQRIMHKSKVCARIKKYLKGGVEILQHIREFRPSSTVFLLLFDLPWFIWVLSLNEHTSI